MAITILAPVPAYLPHQPDNSSSDDDADDGGVNLHGDSDMRPAKRLRHSSDIVTPGEIVTDDPQWMRFVVASLLLLLCCFARILLTLFEGPRHLCSSFKHGDCGYRRRHCSEDQ